MCLGLAQVVQQTVELRGKSCSPIAEQIADQRLAQTALLSAGFELGHLVILARPQVKQREGWQTNLFHAPNVEVITPSQLLIVPRGSARNDDRAHRPRSPIERGCQINPLFSASVSTVAGFNNDDVMQALSELHHRDGRQAQRHVTKRAGVNINRRALARARHHWVERIAQHRHNALNIHHFAGQNCCTSARLADDHVCDTLSHFFTRGGEHDDLHELTRRSDDCLLFEVTTLACFLVDLVVNNNSAKRAARQLGNARHENGGEALRLLVMHFFCTRDDEVLCGLDFGHFSEQTPVREVDLLEARDAATRSAAFGPRCGDAHGRLAKHRCRIDSAGAQGVGQCDHCGGFAFSAACLERRIRGNEHDLAVFAAHLFVGEGGEPAVGVDFEVETIRLGKVSEVFSNFALSHDPGENGVEVVAASLRVCLVQFVQSLSLLGGSLRGWLCG